MGLTNLFVNTGKNTKSYLKVEERIDIKIVLKKILKYEDYLFQKIFC